MMAELRGRMPMMERRDKDEYIVLQSRERDDEDFDAQTVQRLQVLYGKYCKKKSKADAEDRWNKLTKQ